MTKIIIQCYFPIPNFQGFGSYLASIIYLHDYCKNNHLILKNTYSYHSGIYPLIDDIEPVYNKDITIDKIPIIHTIEELEKFMKEHNNYNKYYISYYGGSTDILFNRIKYIDSIEFVKLHCLYFKDILNDKINNTLVDAKCIDKNYISLHLRIGDEELVSKEGVYQPLYDCFISNITKIIVPLLETEKVVIISDSITFKEILKTIIVHPNLYITQTVPSHTGLLQDIDKPIIDTLHDFGIMAHSKKIYIISAQHQHPAVTSFFSRYCSCIYNIPVVIKKIQLEIFSNKSQYIIQ